MKTGVKVYLDYTQEELDYEYDQHALVKNSADYTALNASESARVREAYLHLSNLAFAEHDEAKVDVFPAAKPDAPIILYFHGGAWTRGKKEGVSYLAPRFVHAGACFVAVNFALVPQVTLDTLVRQTHQSVAWAYRHAREIGGNADRLFVVGHSSGGHAVGMLVTTDWQTEFGLPSDLIKGAIATSGIYDLEPVRLSKRNEYLHLDEAAALRNSPIHRIRRVSLPLVIGYGEHDHQEFRRQSKVFAEAWRKHGNTCREIDLAGLNHYEVAQVFTEQDHPLLKIALEMAGLGNRRP